MEIMSNPVSPESWQVVRVIGGEDFHITLPSGAAPGTRLTLGRGDTNGSGTMFVAVQGDDGFGRPGEPPMSTFALQLPMQRCEFEYQRVPVEGTGRTQGVWYRLAVEASS
jgi:hypothetical protein